jgi:hypothetical protein
MSTKNCIKHYTKYYVLVAHLFFDDSDVTQYMALVTCDSCEELMSLVRACGGLRTRLQVPLLNSIATVIVVYIYIST